MAKGSLNQGQLKCDSWSTHRKMEGQWQPTSLLYFFELEIPLSPKLREAVKDQHKEWGETSKIKNKRTKLYTTSCTFMN